MSTITIENPEKVTQRTVNDSGTIYIGREHAGRKVRVTVELVDDEE